MRKELTLLPMFTGIKLLFEEKEIINEKGIRKLLKVTKIKLAFIRPSSQIYVDLAKSHNLSVLSF
jgi:hypothetical protein